MLVATAATLFQMRPLAQCPEQPTIVFSASNCNTKEIAAQFCKTVACADENFLAQEKRAELQGIAAALVYLDEQEIGSR